MALLVADACGASLIAVVGTHLNVEEFLDKGNKVRVQLQFRGREMAHQELGYKLLNRVKEDTAPIAKIESEPRFEGRQMVMLLAPR